MAYFSSRQEDTDTFRFWEVAGASHGPRPQVERRAVKLARDGLAPPPRAGGPPSEIAYSAGGRRRPGPPAAAADRGPAPAAPGPDRDGGRSAGRSSATSTATPGAGSGCPRSRSRSPTTPGSARCRAWADSAATPSRSSAATLAALYSDRADYLARFADAARASVEAGVISAADADRLVAEAAQAPIPRPRLIEPSRSARPEVRRCSRCRSRARPGSASRR